MSKTRSWNPFKWLFRHFWKLSFVVLVGLGAYVFYLDAVIQERFSGNKWQIPAQIYARPLSLHTKQEITVGEIVEELALLGYRKVAKANKTGEYQLSKGKITIMRRAFHFPEGFEPEMAIRITIEQERIREIQHLDQAVDLQNIRLEPWLVTRLVSSGREDRMLVNLEEVPQVLIDALVNVEDKAFFEHHGVAPLSILRALMANISAGKTVQGGSTLTQQLVKNLFLTREKSLVRKAKEALMALVIDARYSKQDILEAYINEVFLGQNGATGVHGFGLASYFYFDRPLNELNVSEIATLVGMIKGPSYYNPRRFPERVATRRNVVLRVLFEENLLSRNEFEPLLAQQVNVATGASLITGKHPAFMDKVQSELRFILADPDIRQSGVKVFSTLDSNAQRKAEKSVQQQLNRIEKQRKSKDLQAAMIVTDIDSGEIRSIVGDRNVDFKGFNRALHAKRSIGSLIKPAIYLTALEQAASYNLATPLKDQPIKLKSSHGTLWEPKNSDKKFRGEVPLITALTRSLNVPTVSLGMELGIPTIIDTIERLGVEEEINGFPALTLGALDLSPIQVNQMYQTMANNGSYIPLHAVTAILSPNDSLMWKFGQRQQQRFDDKATYLLNYALHKVTLEGTAKSIKQNFPTINMAGKTGTTDDYRDSWFSGFDKNILITSWVGRDDNSPTGLTGTTGALSVFTDYQKRQEPKSLVRRFPEGLGIAHFNLADGQVVQAGCKDSLSVPAILEALPPYQNDCNGSRIKPKSAKKKTLWERLFGGS